MTHRKRLGVNREWYCSPLFHGLDDDARFDVHVEVNAANAAAMREHKLDGAFLSPIDYARESSDYQIIPDVAVSSSSASNAVLLLFNRGLHTISRIAVSPASTSEIVLATILLGELYDVRPQIIPTMGSAQTMLATADAALVTGNAVLDIPSGQSTVLDLVEEWNDLTGLPYVHGFWCFHESTFSKEEMEAIQRARDGGLRFLNATARSSLHGTSTQTPDILQEHRHDFSYTFTEQEQNGAAEFLQYAYYHGILPDVPDLNIHRMDDSDEFPSASMN